MAPPALTVFFPYPTAPSPSLIGSLPAVETAVTAASACWIDETSEWGLRRCGMLVPLLLAIDAATLLHDAAAAMGGEATLRAIRSVEMDAVGEREMVEQSERPSGPYFLDHFEFHEIRDLAGRRIRRTQSDSGYAQSNWWLQTEKPDTGVELIASALVATVGDDGKQQYAGGFDVDDAQDQFDFAPERLVVTALDAGSARVLPDVVLHGMRHHLIGFDWHGMACTLALNAQTNLPWQFTFTRAFPHNVFYNAWGDVTTSVTYTEWSLEPGGIRYPREQTYRALGLPDRVVSIRALKFNVPIDEAAMTIAPDILAAHPAGAPAISTRPFGGTKPTLTQIAPSFYQVPGSWNVEFVDQPDGVVVIEAPIDPAYAKAAFAYARAQFHKPVKAVVTTSDSWPHIAGVRQAVAEGITIYALDLNRPILERLIAAPHRILPDDLARHPRPARFSFVAGPTTIGSGASRIDVLPYRTATGERQMIVDLPAARVTYTSDLFAPASATSWFTPQYLDEFESACARYRLAPVTIVGMHYPPTPYAGVVAWLDAFRTGALSPVPSPT